MVPSYLDSYPRDYFLKARSNGLSIQTAARKEKRTFATLICWTVSYLEIRTKEENMLLYLQKEVLVFKSGLSYIVGFFSWGRKDPKPTQVIVFFHCAM